MNKSMILNVFVLSVLLTIIFISLSSMPVKIFLAVFSSLFFIPIVRGKLIKRMIAIVIACPVATLLYYFIYWLITSSESGQFTDWWGAIWATMGITFFIYIAIGIPYSLGVDYVARRLELTPKSTYLLRLALYGVAAVLLALLLDGGMSFLTMSIYVYSYYHILLFIEKRNIQHSGD
ncbi:hypothetical protein V1502_18995 [Bacillus sp. SCS-153A]|uniref:hypothetical protein n=1 Tax=Rossellomorea sedimentorum TaxID=3115294 RepID=UPI003906CA47